MNASYSIDPDPVTGVLAVTLFGFFSVSDIAALRVELLEGIASIGRRPGTHLSLYDIRECKIQSQDVVRALRAMSDTKGVVARRLAVVAGNSLMKMQLSRILVDRETRLFADVGPAMDWLLERSPLLRFSSIQTASRRPSLIDEVGSELPL